MTVSSGAVMIHFISNSTAGMKTLKLIYEALLKFFLSPHHSILPPTMLIIYL